MGVDWQIASGPRLPLPDGRFDIVTSYSVIEHIPDKELRSTRRSRCCVPAGCSSMTFDLCEQSRGMTFPEWMAAPSTWSLDRLV